MLNGQLQLTDTALARPCRACAVRFISRAPSAWSSWPVALQGPARPVVDMAGGAADHRDGPAWRQLRRQAGRHALQDRAFEQRRRRERQALEQSQRSQPDFGGPGARCPVAAPRGGATQVTPVASAKSSSTQPRPLDQPSDSGAATSTPSTATPARRPRRPKLGARDAGVINWAGRPPARSPRASTTTPRASTSPATWATPSSRRPTARSCTAATACAAWAT